MTEGFFATLAGSFHSPALYRRVAVLWRGTGIRYLALLSMLQVTIALLALYGDIALLRSRLLDEADSLPRRLFEHAVSQLPELTFAKGRLQVAHDGPLVIDWPGSDRPMIVIDTAPRPPGTAPERGPLLRMEAAGFRFGIAGQETMLTSYDGIGSGTYTGEEMGEALLAVLRRLDPWSGAALRVVVLEAMPLYGVMFTGLNLIGNLMFAALIAAGGLLLCGPMRLSLPFSMLFRLACVAMTPASLISLAAFVLLLPAWSIYMMPFWLAASIHMGFLFFALCAVRGAGPERS